MVVEAEVEDAVVVVVAMATEAICVYRYKLTYTTT